MKTQFRTVISSLIVGAAIAPAHSALASQLRRFDLNCEFQSPAVAELRHCVAQAHIQLASDPQDREAPPERSILEANQLSVMCNNNMEYSSTASALVKRDGYVIQGLPGPVPAIELGRDAFSRDSKGRSVVATLNLENNQYMTGACSVYALDDDPAPHPTPSPTATPCPSPEPSDRPEPAQNPALTAVMGENDFDSVALGARSGPKTVNVFNTGNVKIEKVKVEIIGENPDEFAIASENCSIAPLEPRDTCSVSVYFAPRSAGKKSASLIFGDGNTPLASSLLEGTGAAQDDRPIYPSVR